MFTSSIRADDDFRILDLIRTPWFHRLVVWILKEIVQKAHGTSLLLCLTLRQFHQLFRHPLANGFRGYIVDAYLPVVPVIARALRTTFPFIILCLFKAQNDSRCNLAPVLKLDASPDQGQ